jgi:crotonobetainyl-CoA:carnitine CoA-transferase CaiB-like acyl-CoA transferase
MKEIFKGVKVVELASVLAGPAVGMFFAELGAEVIKIENATTGGDVTRSWKLPSEPQDAAGSAYFSSVNYGKTHLFFDLEKAEDQQKTLDLLRGCDVVISNFKDSSAQRLGVDYARLKALNPKIIYAQIYGYDAKDDSPAFDVVLQAETGFMHMNGERGGKAVKMPVALIDILAAHQLKEGILIALWQRERTGLGAFVSTSLYESAVASLANQATNWLMAHKIPQRIGSEHPNIAPYGDVFETADNSDIVIACGTEKQWKNLCDALNLSDLKTDNLFKTNALRVQNRQKLVTILRGCILSFERDILLDVLKKNGVPAAAIRTIDDVFQHPLAQGMVLENGEERRVKTVAFKFHTGV